MAFCSVSIVSSVGLDHLLSIFIIDYIGFVLAIVLSFFVLTLLLFPLPIRFDVRNYRSLKFSGVLPALMNEHLNIKSTGMLASSSGMVGCRLVRLPAYVL